MKFAGYCLLGAVVVAFVYNFVKFVLQCVRHVREKRAKRLVGSTGESDSETSCSDSSNE